MFNVQKLTRVSFVEGNTAVEIINAFAKKLNHPAFEKLLAIQQHAILVYIRTNNLTGPNKKMESLALIDSSATGFALIDKAKPSTGVKKIKNTIVYEWGERRNRKLCSCASMQLSGCTKEFS